MKKMFSFTGAMLVSALILTNCTESSEPVQIESQSYTIYANAVDTRTVSDGNLGTLWSEGDDIAVIHAPAGTEDFSMSSEFTLVDAGSGKFTASTLNGELSDANDWYAIYPYYPYSKSDVDDSETGTLASYYLYLGSYRTVNQKQTGNSNMKHIGGYADGGYYPMYGSVLNVDNAEAARLDMTHITSLIKVEVTNGFKNDITVNRVSLTAEESLVGKFEVDFTGESPSFRDAVGANNDHVSNTAVLDVKNGEAVAAGESACFYFAVKPFTASAGEKLVLSVDGYQKELVMKNDVSFKSGMVKTLKFNYDLDVSDVEVVVNSEVGEKVSVEGLIVARYTNGFLVEDDTDIILVYDKGENAVNIGDKVKVTGATSIYDSFTQISATYVRVISTGNQVTYPEPEELTGEEFDALYQTRDIKYIKYTGSLEWFNGYYYNVVVDGASYVGTLAYPLSEFGLENMADKAIVVVEGYYIGAKDRAERYDDCISTMAVSVTDTGEVAEEEKVVPVEAAISEVLAAEVDNDVWYKMTGTVSNIKSTTYGNFDLTDDTGTIYVYGLTATKVPGNDMSFASLGIKEGDIVTLVGIRSVYKGTPQVDGPAFYVSHSTPSAGGE